MASLRITTTGDASLSSQHYLESLGLCMRVPPSWMNVMGEEGGRVSQDESNFATVSHEQAKAAKAPT